MATSRAYESSNSRLKSPWGSIVAFLLPAVTVYVAFTAYPAVRTIWNSFHKVLPRGDEYIGLANYAELAKDDMGIISDSAHSTRHRLRGGRGVRTIATGAVSIRARSFTVFPSRWLTSISSFISALDGW